jgi:A/G-specific adenine glycosylase
MKAPGIGKSGMGGGFGGSKRPRIYHAALMELGQTICRPSAPDCMACPVARFCRPGKPAELPVKARKTAITAVDEHALWLRDADGRLLLHHEAGKRRTGLWKLPVREASEIGICRCSPSTAMRSPATKVNLRVHDGNAAARISRRPGDSWVEPSDECPLAMAAPFRRVVERLLEDF